jgi:5-methylcytosine-specific restriction endonuclease McrA
MIRNSTRARRICFDAHRTEINGRPHLICHVCSAALDPVRDRWEADHIARVADGGADTADNLWPACWPCHRRKSAGDTREIAKGKRVHDRIHGIKRRKGAPLPGTRDSGWKKHMDGSVSRRRE